MMKKNYAIIVMVMIAPSPGPLSKHFGKTVDAILRRDNIEDWVDNKDNIVAEETNADEETGKVIVVNVQEEDDVVTEDNVEDAVDEDDDDVVIISETLGNVVVKEEPVEEVVVVEEEPVEEVVVVEEDDIEIEESTLADDIEIEESNDSIEVHVEDNNDTVSEVDTDFATPEQVTTPAEIAIVAEEVEDDIVYYKDAQVEYEFGEMRKENGVYFVPLRKPVLIQTPVVKLMEPISGDSTIVRVSGGFAKFVKNHEENMLKLTKENKTKWFKNGIEDSALDSGFKSFLESDTLKVKISDDFAAFDTVGDFIDSTFCTPAEVRCILKISGVWFGSAEFGSIMSLVQTQLAKLPKCSIKPTRERKKYNYAGEFA
jgi:hypothetical protein